jgi:DNA-binding transcriptional regulator YiaG
MNILAEFNMRYNAGSPDELRKALDQMGLSQVRAACLFGVNDRTVRRWIKGDQPVPRLVEIVLWLMIKYKVKPAAIP